MPSGLREISKEYKKITGFELCARATNNLYEWAERKDSLFSQLTQIYFFRKKDFIKLRSKMPVWLKNSETETIFALAGYIHYINEDYNKARDCFLKTISLNPNNLDNWLDFAFSLRHTNDYEFAYGIIFNVKYVIYYYKYFNLRKCNLRILRNLVIRISKKIDKD